MANEAITKKYLGLAIAVTSAFLVSVSIGMNAIIFPLTMDGLGWSNRQIGLILSLEVGASLLVCLLLTRMLSLFEIRIGLMLATVVRVTSLLALSLFQVPASWIGLVFAHGIGVFTFLILLQTWVNSIKFRKYKGLMVSLYSIAISGGSLPARS